MLYHVLHSTLYDYAMPVQLAHHLLHLVPRHCPWQRIEAHALRVDPAPTSHLEVSDAFGNPVSCIELAVPHDHLHVESEISLRVAPRPWLGKLDDQDRWEDVTTLLCYQARPLSDELVEAERMRFESPGVRVKRELEEYAAPSFSAKRPLVDATLNLMARIHDEFHYDPEATEVGTTVLEVLERKSGVCQDFAHLMVGCLRSMGLAARYVSGYLRTDPPAGQPRMLGADASHAWVAVYVPAHGWIEFDPTNNCLADERHLVIGWGRDFVDVSPIRGVIQGGGEHTLKVGVTVTPVDEEEGDRLVQPSAEVS
ncbi:MAG TPA: transglutaminase family protein [Aromatoleum sp.]|uniref:transglutaminase family protein n=1 Tax=Aromatoleum sp. TaxID=2307007 RepID=UPI002B45AF29|nr:transglutaminase family protein [Aromatoleum sp.]HJV26330.1 transglutaminase family protein [Aromatoleum sp.]